MAASPPSPASAEPLACCALCGGRDYEPYLRRVVDYLSGEHFDLDRCRQCGLIVTHPMPNDEQIERYYPPRYRGNRHGFTARMRVVLRRRAIERQFPKGFRGMLLDVGCGDGAFVREMHQRGWTVCATEIDSATVDRLRQRHIDAKLPQDAEREGFGNGERFDAVTCWHVMEHVQRPAELARWIKTQLRSGGVFQTTVPNATCAQARLFGRQWLHYDTPRHRYHFSPQTFRRLLNDAGFSVTHQTSFTLEYDWLGVIQSALNLVCSRRNVLFDQLTCAPTDTGRPVPLRDTVLSTLLSPPLALLSIPPLLLDWSLGDGSSLTLVCRG